MTVEREVACRLMLAEQQSAYGWMWVGHPAPEVRAARAVARPFVGSLEAARLAGVGLVPQYRDPQRLIGEVNRGLASAEFNARAHEEELRALGLAHVKGGSLVHSFGGRLLFPLRGADHGIGLAAMSIDGRKPLWRCHTAALGMALPSTLVFEVGLDEVRRDHELVVCGDPAAALRFRAPGRPGWAPIAPVVAPPTRQLHPAQAALIARYAPGKRVGVFVDEDSPKRALQFTAALESAGLEVFDVLEQMRGAVDSMERAVSSLNASRRGRRGRGHPRAVAAAGSDE